MQNSACKLLFFNTLKGCYIYLDFFVLLFVANINQAENDGCTPLWIGALFMILNTDTHSKILF